MSPVCPMSIFDKSMAHISIWVLAASVDVAVPMCRSIFIRRWHVLLWFVGTDMLVVIVRYHFRHTFSSAKAEFMTCYVNLAKFRQTFWWLNFAKVREFSPSSPFFEQMLMTFARNFTCLRRACRLFANFNSNVSSFTSIFSDPILKRKFIASCNY